MGSNEAEGKAGCNKSRWIQYLSCFLILFLSISTSTAGGSVLGLWLHKYHPSNTQLWMVPFGFVLFLTPLIICLSIIVPELCVSKNTSDQEQAFKTPPTDPLPASFSQPNI